jgi:myo-inositol-1(or 4)-monophosphatase
MPNNRPKLTDIENIARQAGEILRAAYGTEHQVNHKGVIDLVTETDLKSEQFILGKIEAQFPDQRMITEETDGLAGSNGRVWYVDPLDGTVNFAHNIPIFSVSLAYVEAGRAELGVVYDPMRDECFSAERERGAFLNGKRLRVSAEMELDQSLLVTGFPYDIRTNPNNNLDHYAKFALCSLGVRRLGSAALDLCYVAAGRFGGYWEFGTNAYDVAAGALIVEEAGGKATDTQGGEFRYANPQPILAANAAVHAQMLAVLNE